MIDFCRIFSIKNKYLKKNHKKIKKCLHCIGGYNNIADGEVAEWSIAAVLKTVEEKSSQGSNPCLSARYLPILIQNSFL